MRKKQHFNRHRDGLIFLLFRARSKTQMHAKPWPKLSATQYFAPLSSLRKSLTRFALTMLMIGLFAGCQNPSVTVSTLSELPESLMEGYNGERWYFNNTHLTPPFVKQKEKNINGLASGFFYPIDGKLILTTFNGYLVSLNRFKLNDVDRLHLARGISVPPAFYRPLIFVASEKGKYGLQAYDLMHRKIIWKKKQLYSRSSPLVENKVVFHATLKGKILAFNGITGKQLWQYNGGLPVTNNLALHGDTLIACTPDGLVICLNAIDGSLFWKQKLPHHVYAAPMILQSKVFIADLHGRLIALQLADGKKVCQAQTSGAPIYQPSSTDGRHLFVMNGKGQLFCFLPNLKKVWQKDLTGVPMQPVLVTADYLLVNTAQKYFYVLKKQTGEIIQQARLKHRANAVLAGDAQTLYMSIEYDHLAKWQSKGAGKK